MPKGSNISVMSTELSIISKLVQLAYVTAVVEVDRESRRHRVRVVFLVMLVGDLYHYVVCVFP